MCLAAIRLSSATAAAVLSISPGTHYARALCERIAYTTALTCVKHIRHIICFHFRTHIHDIFILVITKLITAAAEAAFGCFQHQGGWDVCIQTKLWQQALSNNYIQVTRRLMPQQNLQGLF